MMTGKICLLFAYTKKICLFTLIVILYRGKPPYPLLSDLNSDEVDHLSISMDMYHIRKNFTLYPIVGYLKEFLDQQNSGMTEFVLPPRT